MAKQRRNKRLTRRGFLRSASAGLLSAGAEALGGRSPDANERHVVCGTLTAGIPLGGIGAGSVEVRDDGLFHDWQIFNNWQGEHRSLFLEGTFFAVTWRTDSVFGSRKLACGEDTRGGVERIDYTGEFPYARLEYIDRDMPLSLALTAWSPFIPHDEKNSGLPAAVFEFEVENRSAEELEVSLAFAVQNGALVANPDARANNSVAEGDGWKGVVLSSRNLPDGSPWMGTLAACVLGGGEVGEVGIARSEKLAVLSGKTGRATFLLTWHFPNDFDSHGLFRGHAYDNIFSSASEVAEYVASNLSELSDRTRAFHDAFYSGGLDYWLLDAINAQFTNFFKNSRWTKEGEFGICGGRNAESEADSACIPPYQETEGGRLPGCWPFPLVMMFPELEKMAIRGLISDGSDAAASVPEFPILAWRDYLVTGDDSQLRELWPHVRAAMGLVRQHSDLALIRIAALRASARIARVLQEGTVADEYERLATLGSKSVDEQLWNGESYDFADEICRAAHQLGGQWYARLLDLGYLLPADRLRSSLSRIVCGSDRAEDQQSEGAPCLAGHYLLASLLIMEEMVEDGLSLARAAYDRATESGNLWNNEACGEHCCCPMEAITILLAAQSLSRDEEPSTGPEKQTNWVRHKLF